MQIGIPKERKAGEFRVGMTPAGVAQCCKAGHTLLVEKSAGTAIGFSDQLFIEAGAELIETSEELWDRSELIVKVKEPQPSEYPLLREGQTLFAFLHLAADPEQTAALVRSGVTAIAYETIRDAAGRLPLLRPMSEIAGQLSVQVGAHLLQLHQGGKGLLMGGVAGVPAATVAILGGGTAGTEAARIAMGLRARLLVLDNSLERLSELDRLYGGRLSTLYATESSIAESVATADLLIGAVLVAGKRAPKLVSRAMVAAMEPCSVIVDVAIDQGGVAETSRPTSHSAPTYLEEGVLHYCVPNMPGSCSRTATLALTQVTLGYLLKLASSAIEPALRHDPHLLAGLSVYRGFVTDSEVAQELGYTYHPAVELLPC